MISKRRNIGSILVRHVPTADASRHVETLDDDRRRIKKTLINTLRKEQKKRRRFSKSKKHF